MSSSGLDWRPVLQMWLQKQSARDSSVLAELFDATFSQVYSWLTQNLSLTMKVLQANVIKQMIDILDGLVPKHDAQHPQVGVISRAIPRWPPLTSF
jgi:dynein heavy chain, axonemal